MFLAFCLNPQQQTLTHHEVDRAFVGLRLRGFHSLFPNRLINILKEGIEYQPHSRKVMFSIYASKEQYMGILCTAKELNTVNGKTTISEDCIVVPVYEFVV